MMRSQSWMPTVYESQEPRWKAFYNDVQKLRDFHALALDPAILNALEVLFGESVPAAQSQHLSSRVSGFGHPFDAAAPGQSAHRWIGRDVDGVDSSGRYSRESWVGSRWREGRTAGARLEDKEAVGGGYRQVEVEDDTVWIGGDYACGDVMFLHSMTVHQGRDNASNRLRVSYDFRYQPSEPPGQSRLARATYGMAHVGRCLREVGDRRSGEVLLERVGAGRVRETEVSQ